MTILTVLRIDIWENRPQTKIFSGSTKYSLSICSLKPIHESMLPVSRFLPQSKQVYLLVLCICRTFAASKVFFGPSDRVHFPVESCRFNLKSVSFIYSFLNFETTDFHKFHQFSRCCGLVTCRQSTRQS